MADPARHRWLGAEAKQNRGLKAKPITGLEGETGNFPPTISAGSSPSLWPPVQNPIQSRPKQTISSSVACLWVVTGACVPARDLLSDTVGIVRCPLAYEVSCCPVGRTGFRFRLCARRPRPGVLLLRNRRGLTTCCCPWTSSVTLA